MRSRVIVNVTIAAIACSILGVCSARVGAVEFPGAAPGEARATLDEKHLVLENKVLSVTWNLTPSGPVLAEVTDRISGKTLRGKADYSLSPRLAREKVSTADSNQPIEKPSLSPLAVARMEPRIATRFGGWMATVPVVYPDSGTRIEWRLTLRGEANYVHQEVIVTAGSKPLEPDTLTLLRLGAPGASAAGEVDGSPVVCGNLFFACEHPMASNRGDKGEVSCSAGTFRALKPGESCRRSCVIGVAPPGQMRRAFSYYLERERPRPYQPFLHYNSWYDIAWGDRKMDEGQCLTVIDLFGRELIEKRGVKLDSVVFDDGWDDNRSLWRFHQGFPRGFTPLTEAAARRGTSIGVWLSPWGGYGKAKDERLQYGKTQGFETNGNGFSLAGPNYYGRFRQVCLEMIAKFKVNYFKFDGIAQGIYSPGAGAQYAGDVDGLLRLIGDLRKARSDVFVNVTTGTWPSPFWLLTADSIWRNGGDMGFHGPGSMRQQWITYRDLHTYRGIVRRSPLYPINSLMTQGICHAKLGDASKLKDDLGEMASEIRSFFGSGTQLQELYITPQMMTTPMWDLLAEGANWSRKNADVLADVHWIGGDPGQGQVYGFAAWSPRLGILTLRNPTPAPASFSLDLGKAFELPAGAAAKYRLKSPWKDEKNRAELTAAAGQPERIDLAPFGVVVLEATPVP